MQLHREMIMMHQNDHLTIYRRQFLMVTCRPFITDHARASSCPPAMEADCSYQYWFRCNTSKMQIISRKTYIVRFALAMVTFVTRSHNCDAILTAIIE